MPPNIPAGNTFWRLDNLTKAVEESLPPSLSVTSSFTVFEPSLKK